MNIITGYRGEPHITAQEDRDINLGVVGNSLTDVYVLNVGQQLEADIVSANEVRIRDGILIMQGCAASIDYGAYDSLTISNGTQGMLRTDIIAAQYEKDADTNVESLTLVVIEGTPDASDPQAPTLQGGDIQGGDNLVQLPLYQVNIDGVSIDSVEAQFIAATSLSWCTLSAATIAKWDDIAGGASNDEIMDYVADNTIIEEGTSGIWHYRKYGSGLLVLDGTHAGTSGSMGGYGNGFATDEKTVSFPSMLASIYSFASGLYFNATTGYLSVSQVQASSGIKYRIAALANTSSRGYTAYFHVVGTWDND